MNFDGVDWGTIVWVGMPLQVFTRKLFMEGNGSFRNDIKHETVYTQCLHKWVFRSQQSLIDSTNMFCMLSDGGKFCKVIENSNFMPEGFKKVSEELDREFCN